jgi:hypothetical protein
MNSKAKEKKRILVMTAPFPFAEKGACPQDRTEGVKQLIRLGYEVRVVAMCRPRDLTLLADAEKEIGVPITPIVYTFKREQRPSLMRRLVRLFNPRYWDGAAFEFSDPQTKHTFQSVVKQFRPDIVWFDYTYLWPLYPIARQSGAKIVTRSINYEPQHFLDEDAPGFLGRIKYWSKVLSEEQVIRESDHLFSITHREEDLYRSMGATHVSTLPLRALPRYIGKNSMVHDRHPLNVFFMGANYKITHMRDALSFILSEVIPQIESKYPGVFCFHAVGANAPEAMINSAPPSFHYHGYVRDLEVFLSDMDIALAPSLMGAGMQQKVWEPIVRGIPTITSPRALAGYNIEGGTEVMLATTADEFVLSLEKMISLDTRKSLSRHALAKAGTLFTRPQYDTMVESVLTKLLA